MKKKAHPFLHDLKKNRTKWLMILPAAIVVVLMCYIPMAGIVLAFKEFNYHGGIWGSPWAGLFFPVRKSLDHHQKHDSV